MRHRRSALGYVALAIAALLAVVAIILPSYVADVLIKFPAQVRQVTISSGTGTVLDLNLLVQGRLQIQHEVPIQLSTLVTSIEPTDSRTVTLRVAQQSTRLDRPLATTR
ncbi:porin PorA family protein [Nocardia sp. NBC_00881]|uniref:porin PorA family protein n=1 Tax=Nocardia sp. NBC_00881 TaxID=2975995 RepID=UPI003869A105|nr:porin PorA family protein [Nocardia sp. NBC_00881]